MKNGDALPESISGCLANYLERHKELITTSWVERVRNSRAVPTASMTRPEIVDHIPDIFDAIIRALRHPLSDTAMEQIQETSGEHVVLRWQKGYALYAVLREIAALRTEFIYQLRLFEEAHPEFGMTQRLFASTTIHRILDYVICDGTDKFLKLTQGKSIKRLTKRSGNHTPNIAG
jgi:hypothetical protein